MEQYIENEINKEFLYEKIYTIIGNTVYIFDNEEERAEFTNNYTE